MSSLRLCPFKKYPKMQQDSSSRLGQLQHIETYGCQSESHESSRQQLIQSIGCTLFFGLKLAVHDVTHSQLGTLGYYLQL